MNSQIKLKFLLHARAAHRETGLVISISGQHHTHGYPHQLSDGWITKLPRKKKATKEKKNATHTHKHKHTSYAPQCYGNVMSVSISSLVEIKCQSSFHKKGPRNQAEITLIEYNSFDILISLDLEY